MKNKHKNNSNFQHWTIRGYLNKKQFRFIFWVVAGLSFCISTQSFASDYIYFATVKKVSKPYQYSWCAITHETNSVRIHSPSGGPLQLGVSYKKTHGIRECPGDIVHVAQGGVYVCDRESQSD